MMDDERDDIIYEWMEETLDILTLFDEPVNGLIRSLPDEFVCIDHAGNGGHYEIMLDCVRRRFSQVVMVGDSFALMHKLSYGLADPATTLVSFQVITRLRPAILDIRVRLGTPEVLNEATTKAANAG